MDWRLDGEVLANGAGSKKAVGAPSVFQAFLDFDMHYSFNPQLYGLGTPIIYFYCGYCGCNTTGIIVSYFIDFVKGSVNPYDFV